MKTNITFNKVWYKDLFIDHYAYKGKNNVYYKAHKWGENHWKVQQQNHNNENYKVLDSKICFSLGGCRNWIKEMEKFEIKKEFKILVEKRDKFYLGKDSTKKEIAKLNELNKKVLILENEIMGF